MATAPLTEDRSESGSFALVLIGGGPTCTYVLERLAAVLRVRPPNLTLDIHIFDRHGCFGSGQNHSSRQPKTSVLNRICSQIAFGADATNPGVATAPTLTRFDSLHNWCAQRYAVTGDPRYALAASSWPPRYIFGEAIEEAFAGYVSQLENVAGIRVACHAREVADVTEVGDGRLLVTAEEGPPLLADHIIFLTGHGARLPPTGTLEAKLTDLAANGRRAFVSYAYPLEKRIASAVSGTDSVVCLLGLGLTAIDVVLHLTEGRGGRFDHKDGRLTYVRSGSEPKSIVGCSPSGLLTHARGDNQKESDPASLEHCGVFFTCEAVDRLRQSAGVPIEIAGIGCVRQLDFDHHLWPLMLLEMQFVYYRALLGPSFAATFRDMLDPEFERFIAAPDAASSDDPFGAKIAPLVDAAFDTIAQFLATGNPVSSVQAELLTAYFAAVLTPEDCARVDPADPASAAFLRDPALRSRDGRAIDPNDHRFDFVRLSDPVGSQWSSNDGNFNDAVIAFMRADHARATHGNLDNPWKAACDAVWRDLRPVLTHAIDHGGLNARSHERFLLYYMRLHNRLGNGACVEVMEKMLALVECGLLDLGVGPFRTVESSADGQAFDVIGVAGKRRVDTIIDAKLHAFDPALAEGPLYPSMLAASLLRRWRNPEVDGPGFEPGGLDLSAGFHPVRADGSEDRRMTFLGPPSEGIVFFQVGAARPFTNHHVLNDVIGWIDEFECSLRARHVL